MDEVLRLARPEIRALRAYDSDRGPADVRGIAVYLDANENPYPPYPAAEELFGLNRYPEPQPQRLLGRLAEHFGVTADRVLLSRGAEEAIGLVVRAFCAAGRDSLLVNTPTFAMYETAARIQDARIHRVPLRADAGYQLDVDAILRIADEDPGLKVVFACTPNNPTGNLLDRADVLRLADALRGRALVVADQTYIEFSGEAPIAAEIDRHPNLVALRSLSKAYSLAGERCGATIAQPAVIDLLTRIIAPYPLTQSAVRVLEQAMSPDGVAYAQANIARVRAERTRLADGLRGCPAISHVFPSEGNFILFRTLHPALLVSMLRHAGVKVRNRSTVPGLDGCVRITVGLPEHTDLVLKITTDYATQVLTPEPPRPAAR